MLTIFLLNIFQFQAFLVESHEKNTPEKSPSTEKTHKRKNSSYGKVPIPRKSHSGKCFYFLTYVLIMSEKKNLDEISVGGGGGFYVRGAFSGRVFPCGSKVVFKIMRIIMHT